MKYFDVHAHIHSPQFDADREEVIARMKEKGVGCICAGTSLEESKKAVALAEQYDFIWATVGIHPTDTEELFDEKNFEELVRHPKVVAVGECGLDYYRIENSEGGIEKEKERQKENFTKQIEFALKHNKPLMIHCRPSTNGGTDAHEDLLSILNSYLVTHNSLRGNVHFFTGSLHIASQYFARGFTVSTPGVVTFSKEVAHMVKELPLESVLVETDCPYATPVPHRGERNEPAFIVATTDKIAQLKGLSPAEFSSQLLQTAKNIFAIP